MRTYYCIFSSLIGAAFTFLACAQDNVFEQPAMEARVNAPDLAQRIDTVVDGRITGIDRDTGVFTINGRRVQFAASYDEAPQPPELIETAETCVNGDCFPVNFKAARADYPFEIAKPCAEGGCARAAARCNSCASGTCPLPSLVPGSVSFDLESTPRETLVRSVCPSGNCGGCAGGTCGYPGVTERVTIIDPQLVGHFSGLPYADGCAEDINNGCGGAYRPFSSGNFVISPSEARALNALEIPAPVVARVRFAPELLQPMPEPLRQPACSFTRIVLHDSNGAARAGSGSPGVAPAIRPSRRLQPELTYKFSGSPTGDIVLMNSADFNHQIGLQTGNVLQPMVHEPDNDEQNDAENETAVAAAADAPCVCSGTIVITPNNPRYIDHQAARAAILSDDRKFVAKEQEPMNVSMGNANDTTDTIVAIKSLPDATIRDLRVGDEVLVGYMSGETDSPQFVIKAPR